MVLCQNRWFCSASPCAPSDIICPLTSGTCEHIKTSTGTMSCTLANSCYPCLPWVIFPLPGHLATCRPGTERWWSCQEGLSHFSAYLKISSAAFSALWPQWDAPLLRAEPWRSVPAFSLFPWFISLSELTCCLMLPPTNPW